MITFRLNGSQVAVEATPMARLLDVLREDLGAVGSKEGCGEGECGACTVLVDGQAVMSCLVPVIQVDGTEVRTIEGLATDGRLSALQDAFVRMGGTQCGICTPGFLVMAQQILDETKGQPTRRDIREGLAGNLCRCTGYQKIVDAVMAVLVPDAEVGA
jgi:aerobic carbon-monoxide dehydrogenase small subunit